MSNRTGWIEYTTKETDGTQGRPVVVTVEELAQAGGRSQVKILSMTGTHNAEKQYKAAVPEWITTSNIHWSTAVATDCGYISLTDAQDDIEAFADFFSWHLDKLGSKDPVIKVLERLILPEDDRDGKWTREDLDKALRELLSES